jgi:hypothetical protein
MAIAGHFPVVRLLQLLLLALAPASPRVHPQPVKGVDQQAHKDFAGACRRIVRRGEEFAVEPDGRLLSMGCGSEAFPVES